MNQKKAWSKILGFQIGDKVRIKNRKLLSYNLHGEIIGISKREGRTYYRVRHEEDVPCVLWVEYEKEDLELIEDE